MRGQSTEYNACDTTALYVIGLHELLVKTPFTKEDEGNDRWLQINIPDLDILYNQDELQETQEQILYRHRRGIKKVINNTCESEDNSLKISYSKAINYIQAHVDSRGLFFEDPQLAGEQ